MFRMLASEIKLSRLLLKRPRNVSYLLAPPNLNDLRSSNLAFQILFGGICPLNYCENSKLAFSTLNSITAKGIKIVGRVWLGFEHSNMFHSQNGDNLIFWRQIRKTMILGVLLFLSVTFDTYTHIIQQTE